MTASNAVGWTTRGKSKKKNGGAQDVVDTDEYLDVENEERSRMPLLTTSILP